jgi:Domain of unknown function (DUF4412)
MKLNARHAICLAVFAVAGCHKNPAPAPSGSAAALSSGAALPAGSLAVLDGFEGEIAVTAKGKLAGKPGAEAANFVLQVKDGKFRVDLPEGLAGSQGLGKAYALVTPAEKKLYVVMDAKKQVILLDFDKLANQAKMLSQAHPHPGGDPPAEVQKTGKTDTVAGYTCEIWHIAQAKSGGDLCIAEQGTSWFHIPLSGLPAEFAWATELTDGKHFPLRFVATENGVEAGRIEVTRIQQEPLPASSFVVPAGYPVMDLEQMLGAMLGGMGGGMPPGALPSGFAPGMLPPGFHPGARGPKKTP